MSETPPNTVQSDAIAFVVTENDPPVPFVEGTLKRRIDTRVYPKISEMWPVVTD